jgi:hypothetical protein
LIEALIQNWDGSDWVNFIKATCTYDANNNLIEQLIEDWDGFNWVNELKITYTYNEINNMIDQLWQNWNGSNWVNNIKITHTYDTNYNNMIEELVQVWDGLNWGNSGKHTYNYDSNNYKIEVLYQEWDGSFWVNTDKYIYSYVPTDVKLITNEVYAYSLSNNYPNPFNPSTTVKYQILEISFVTLKVYDVLGNEITTLVNEEKPAGEYEVEFNATNLPSRQGSALTSGIYFYQLKAGSFVETRKMVLIK